MPMWCSSSDAPQRDTNFPEPHHRIVRIPSGESVVLNSAERAPYLLLIEIVHSDLDFDPSKRSNREVLKRILVKEEEGRTGSRETLAFKSGEPSAMRRQDSLSSIRRSDSAFGEDVAHPETSVVTQFLPSNVPEPSGGEEEEMDLVEQLYGADSELRSLSIDLEETVVLPLPPKNRELDMAAWSLADSNQNAKPDGAAPQQQKPSDGGAPEPQVDSSSRVLSLDEYSERMRTAAVMLAQLNTNLARDSISASSSSAGSLESASPLRWVPGATWLTGTGGASSEGQLGGDQPGPGPSSATAMRMRLQPAEAQAIRNRIMDEMLALEEERMARMRENRESEGVLKVGDVGGNMRTAEDEGIIRRELSKADPSAVVFSESWAAKKVCIGRC